MYATPKAGRDNFSRNNSLFSVGLFDRGSAYLILNRMLLPMAKAIVTMINMVTAANFPVVRINRGAETKKPLPIMDASGVTVARHMIDRRIFRLKSTTKENNVIPITIRLFSMKIKKPIL